jgi:hypothetical protein
VSEQYDSADRLLFRVSSRVQMASQRVDDVRTMYDPIVQAFSVSLYVAPTDLL